MHRFFAALSIAAIVLTGCARGQGDRPASWSAGRSPTPAPAASSPRPAAAALAASGHPRLWLTPAGVERYRQWAAAGNPLWQDGLRLLGERARVEMDEGRVPAEDCGNVGYEEYPTESYAELFAFLSLVDPDPAARQDYAQRARTLLMHIMDLAAKGPTSKENATCNGSRQYPPFRHPDFFTSDRDRARYHGEAFPLVVDWIYASLTTEDKATIRQVFLRWSEEIITAGYHHPEPVGLTNDPQLLADQQQVRFAGNNYFAAHMRNLGLMALALDEGDDPDGALAAYLDIATGAYLYLFNHLVATDSRGGLLPEGFEYSPQTASYVAQFLWALQSSQAPGATEAVDRAFWSDFVASYLHSISPGALQFDRDGQLLMEYQPAWYGDSVVYDRAETNGPGYAKRWWLQLAAPAAIDGATAQARTPGGQQLTITALLPTGARLQAVNRAEPVVEDAIAHNEPMTVRLMSQAAGDPAATRFLHVLQAGDAGSGAFSPMLVRSKDGRWEGALVGDTVVLFAQSVGQALSGALRYTAPGGAAVHVITGLAPNAGYDVQLARADGGTAVSIQPGSTLQADEGGVLVVR